MGDFNKYKEQAKKQREDALKRKMVQDMLLKGVKKPFSGMEGDVSSLGTFMDDYANVKQQNKYDYSGATTDEILKMANTMTPPDPNAPTIPTTELAYAKAKKLAEETQRNKKLLEEANRRKNMSAEEQAGWNEELGITDKSRQLIRKQFNEQAPLEMRMKQVDDDLKRAYIKKMFFHENAILPEEIDKRMEKNPRLDVVKAGEEILQEREESNKKSITPGFTELFNDVKSGNSKTALKKVLKAGWLNTRALGQGLLDIPASIVKSVTFMADPRFNLTKRVIDAGLNPVFDKLLPLGNERRKQNEQAFTRVLDKSRDYLNKYLEEVGPDYQKYKQDYFTKMSTGAGSVIGFMLATALSRGMNITPEVAVGLSGLLSQTGSMADDTYRKTGDFDKAYLSFLAGIPLGYSERFGLGELMSNIDKLSHGSVKRVLIEALREGTEETLQEGFQSFGEAYSDNLITDAGRDPLKEALDGISIAAPLGFLFPFGTAGVTKIYQRMRNVTGGRTQAADEKQTPPPSPLPEGDGEKESQNDLTADEIDGLKDAMDELGIGEMSNDKGQMPNVKVENENKSEPQVTSEQVAGKKTEPQRRKVAEVTSDKQGKKQKPVTTESTEKDILTNKPLPTEQEGGTGKVEKPAVKEQKTKPIKDLSDDDLKSEHKKLEDRLDEYDKKNVKLEKPAVKMPEKEFDRYLELHGEMINRGFVKVKGLDEQNETQGGVGQATTPTKAGKVKQTNAFGEVRISDITKKLKDYQGRQGEDYSEQTFNRIVNDVKAGTLVFDALPPIQLFERKNGDLELLAGHSRLAAFEYMNKEGIEYKGKDFSSIRSQIIRESDGVTYEQAKKIAQESNQGAVQKPTDNAVYLRGLREKGEISGDADQKQRAEDLYGKSGAQYVIDLSYLNPKGKTFQMLKSLSKSSDKDYQRRIESIASWIGGARKKFDDMLSDKHENEMFDWLMDENNFNLAGNKTKFAQRVQDVIDKPGFDPRNPLNLPKRESLSNAELEYRRKVSKLESEIRDQEKLLKDRRKELSDRKLTDKSITNADINRVLEPIRTLILDMSDELTELKKQEGRIKAAGDAEIGLFGSVPEKQQVTAAVTDEKMNKVRDDIADLEEEIRKSMGDKLVSGYDPKLALLTGKLISKYIQLGYYKIEQVARQIVAAGMERLLPYLKEAYNKLRQDDNLSASIKNELSDENEVRGFDTEGFAERLSEAERESILGDRELSAADRAKSGDRRPALRYANDQNLPDVKREYAVKGKYDIDEHQRYAVNLALQRYAEYGRAFLLADGPGVGKTREQLVIANEYKKVVKTGESLPILIITESDRVIKDSFTKDAAALNIGLSDFEIGTYGDLRDGKVGKQEKYGLVIYDEAHNLKNAETGKAKASRNINADNVLYATATPMDKPASALYFIGEIADAGEGEVAQLLGLKLEYQDDLFDGEGGQVVTLMPGVTEADVIQKIIDLRNKAISKGAMIRREYPFFGTVKNVESRMPDADFERQNTIFDKYKQKITSVARSRNLGEREKKKIMKKLGQKRASELHRLTESLKADMIYGDALKEIKAGKQVIFAAEYVNDSVIESIGHTVESSLSQLKRKLEKDGIKYAELYGGNKVKNRKAMIKFQTGQVQALLMTYKSGGVGINLDDVEGDKPRVMFVLSPSHGGDMFQQVIGRVSRRNTQSPADVRLVYFEDSFNDNRRREIINNKMRTLNAIQEGADVDSYDAGNADIRFMKDIDSETSDVKRQTESEAFKKWFGDSKVVDADGKPLVVYSVHSNSVMWGTKYDPKKSTAGGFYATEDPQVASNYATGKLGIMETFENGSEYRLKSESGKFNKKIWQYKLTDKQLEKLQEMKKRVDEDGNPVFNGLWNMDNYIKEYMPYEKDVRRWAATGGSNNLQNIFEFNEQMGNNIAYDKQDKPGEYTPAFLRQTKGEFDEILDELGIEWTSATWRQPGVYPLYLKIENPIDAEKPFPADLLKALKKEFKYARLPRNDDYAWQDTWTKEYNIKNWLNDIESGSESWSTQIPKKALPIIKSFGYDGIKEVGLKNSGLPREKRQINWIAFDANQIKSATGNRGTFDPNNPDIRFKKDDEGRYGNLFVVEKALKDEMTRLQRRLQNVEFELGTNSVYYKTEKRLGEIRQELIKVRAEIAKLKPKETDFGEDQMSLFSKSKSKSKLQGEYNKEIGRAAIGRLGKTGLASDVRLVSSDEMLKLQKKYGNNDAVAHNAFTLPESGEVVLNEDKLDAESPIHEYGHLFGAMMRKEKPGLWNAGLKIIKQAPADLVEYVRTGYPGLKGDKFWDEVLMQAVGSDGKSLFNEQSAMSNENQKLFNRLKAWIKRFWDKVKSVLLDKYQGKGDRRVLAIEKLDMNTATFKDLSMAIASDLLSGNKVVFEKEVEEAYSDLGLVNAELAADKSAAYSKGEYAEPFYSQLERVAEAKVPATATKQMVMNILDSQEIKKEEVEWLGIKEWLNEKYQNPNDKVKKQDLMDFIAQNKVQIEEKVLGGNWITPGTMYELTNLEDGGYTEIGDYTIIFENDMYNIYDKNGDKLEEIELADSVIEWLNENTDVSGARNTNWQLPGGENPREIVFSIPTIDFTTDATHYGDIKGTVAWVRVNDRYTDVVEQREPYLKMRAEKMLFIEEVQSRLHQLGRKEGYKDAGYRLQVDRVQAEMLENRKKSEPIVSKLNNRDIDLEPEEFERLKNEADRLNDEYVKLNVEEQNLKNRENNAVPDAPFKKTWHELVMKRMIRYAAENGYDAIGWTTGVQQVDRYNEAMRQQVDKLEWYANSIKEYKDSEIYSVQVKGYKDGIVTFDENIPIEGTTKIAGKTVTLEDVVGKNIAEKIVNDVNAGEITGNFEGEGLTIGGEGMKGFYDKMLPSFVNKYAKKWGGKVTGVKLQVPRKSSEIGGESDILVDIKDYLQDSVPDINKTDFWDAVHAAGLSNRQYDLIKKGIKINNYNLDNIKWDIVKQKLSLTDKELFTYIKSLSGNEITTLPDWKLKDLIQRYLYTKPAQEPIHKLDITPEMANSVLYSGQAMFMKQGKVIPPVRDQQKALESEKAKNVTETEAFKAWFGDSKVVDKDGKPLVVYHGTDKDFNEFGAGMFTPDAKIAGDYAIIAAKYDGVKEGQNVLPVYLKLENPYILNKNNLKKVAYELGYNKSELEGFVEDYLSSYGSYRDSVERWIKNNGYDGYIIYNDLMSKLDAKLNPTYTYTRTKSYVVFEPTQIKSATGNTGAFDAGNPDIRFMKDPSGKYPPKPPLAGGDVNSLYVRKNKTISDKVFNNNLDKLGKIGAKILIDARSKTPRGTMPNVKDQMSKDKKQSGGQVQPPTDAKSFKKTINEVFGNEGNRKPFVLTEDQADKLYEAAVRLVNKLERDKMNKEREFQKRTAKTIGARIQRADEKSTAIVNKILNWVQLKPVEDLYAKTIGKPVFDKASEMLLKPKFMAKIFEQFAGVPDRETFKKLWKEMEGQSREYKELAKDMANSLYFKDMKSKAAYTLVEQRLMEQMIRGNVGTPSPRQGGVLPLVKGESFITIKPSKENGLKEPLVVDMSDLKQRVKRAKELAIEMKKLGELYDVLPIETYNSKLSRKRIAWLLKFKTELEMLKATAGSAVDGPADGGTASQRGALSLEWVDAKGNKSVLKFRNAAEIQDRIDSTDKMIKNNFKRGGEGYFKRVYVSKELEKTLSRYGIIKPTKLDLTSAIHRKDIPLDVRVKMGEVLTAAYPTAKSIVLEGKDISIGRFFETISENAVWSSHQPVEGWEKVPDSNKYGKLRNMHVHPEVWKALNDVIKFSDPGYAENFVKQLTSIWKAVKVPMNPPTVSRNIINNFIMQDYSGTSWNESITQLPKALKEMRNYARNGKNAPFDSAQGDRGEYAHIVSEFKSTSFSAQEMLKFLDDYEKMGIDKPGFMDLSLPDKILKIVGKGTLVDTPIGTAALNFYQGSEVAFKMVKFLDSKAKGMTDEEAVNEANKWLFDYGDIPSWVKKYRESLFGGPFVTWSYKAFPRVIEAAVTRPISFWKYPAMFYWITSAAIRALGMTDDDWEQIKKDMPDRMKQGQWLLVPYRDGKGQIQMLDLTFIMPYQDIYTLGLTAYTLATEGTFPTGATIAEGLGNMLGNPLMSTTIELSTNYNRYNRREIWNAADKPAEKYQKMADYIYKMWMPSFAPETNILFRAGMGPASTLIPDNPWLNLSRGGYVWDKLRSAITGRPDYYGRVFDLGPAIGSSIFGLKTTPIDPDKLVDDNIKRREGDILDLQQKKGQVIKDDSIPMEQRLKQAGEIDDRINALKEEIKGYEKRQVPAGPEAVLLDRYIRSLQRDVGKKPELQAEINKLKIDLDILNQEKYNKDQPGLNDIKSRVLKNFKYDKVIPVIKAEMEKELDEKSEPGKIEKNRELMRYLKDNQNIPDKSRREFEEMYDNYDKVISFKKDVNKINDVYKQVGLAQNDGKPYSYKPSDAEESGYSVEIDRAITLLEGGYMKSARYKDKETGKMKTRERRKVEGLMERLDKEYKDGKITADERKVKKDQIRDAVKKLKEMR